MQEKMEKEKKKTASPVQTPLPQPHFWNHLMIWNFFLFHAVSRLVEAYRKAEGSFSLYLGKGNPHPLPHFKKIDIPPSPFQFPVRVSRLTVCLAAPTGHLAITPITSAPPSPTSRHQALWIRPPSPL